MSDGILTAEGFIAHVRATTDFFPAAARLEAHLITGTDGSVEGYVNQVARVTDVDTGRSVIAKQLLPYVRRAPELSGAVPLSLRRASIEAASFALYNQLLPGSAPVIYSSDPAAAVNVMEDLSALKLVRFELARLRQFPLFGAQVGRFLAAKAFHTSDVFLPTEVRLAMTSAFTTPDFREMYERAFFSLAFFLPVSSDEPLRAELDAFRTDPAVVAAVLELRDTYLNRTDCLIHGDFHTSNLLVNAERTAVIDGEAASFGPASYDLGTLLGNLIVSCLSLQVLPGVTASQVIEYEDFLIDTVRTVFTTYEAEFTRLWQTKARPELRASDEFRSRLVRRTLQEAAGYASIIAFDHCQGMGTSYDFRRVTDRSARAMGQRLVLVTARRLLAERHNFTRVDDVTDIFKRVKRAYRLAVDIADQVAALT